MNNLRRLLSTSVETEAEAIPENSFDLSPLPLRTKAIDSILTKQEVEAMMMAAKDLKDKSILCLGLIGLRASEIASIRKEWVDLSNRTIRIPAAVAKRNKMRVVPFGEIAYVAEILRAFFMQDTGSIALSRIQIWNRVKGMASRAGVTHSVTPHGLRATGATMFASAGWSITGLQDHFGWSTLKTAEHYIRSSGTVAIEDMKRFGSKVL